MTPAMHLATSSQGDFISGLVRTLRLRQSSLNVLLVKDLRAIAYAEESENNQLLAFALKECITADRLLSAAAEVDDVGLSVSHEPAFRITQVISFSELGRKILGNTFHLGEEKIVPDIKNRRMDILGALSVTPAHSVFSEMLVNNSLQGLLKNCGFLCEMNMLLRGHMGILKSAYLSACKRNRHQLVQYLEKHRAFFDIAPTILRHIDVKEFPRLAIAGGALVGEYEPGSTRREFRIDLEGLSKVETESPVQSVQDKRSYLCFEELRELAALALTTLVYWKDNEGYEDVLDQAMEEIKEKAECARSNKGLSANADAIIEFITKSRAALAKPESKSESKSELKSEAPLARVIITPADQFQVHALAFTFK